MYKHHWKCRFCGKPYRGRKETEFDGFCSSACEMALYRARKKYVRKGVCNDNLIRSDQEKH